MKNLLTSDKLRKKFNPERIYRDIRKTYQKHFIKLQLVLGSNDSPLIKYDYNPQMSFLDTNKSNIDELVKELAMTLKDTVYFMCLSKKKRTSISRKMRLYFRLIAENQLERIKIILNESEMGFLKELDNPLPKHKGIEYVYSILNMLKINYEFELKRLDNLPRVGYLTGFQVSMGNFFQKLRKISMSQKDQITLVQKLFDDFKVDWNITDRENIKISIQRPAFNYIKLNKKYKKDYIDSSFSNVFSEDIITNFIDHAKIMQKRFRRF